jgi:hypothetical protein
MHVTDEAFLGRIDGEAAGHKPYDQWLYRSGPQVTA